MSKIFQTLSCEAIDPIITPEPPTEDIAEQILTDDAAVEADSIGGEVVTDLNTISEAEDHVSTLSDEFLRLEGTCEDRLINHHEDDPTEEEISNAATVITVGQEALTRVCGNVGLPVPVNIGREDIKENVLSAYRITREGISDTIERIIRMIREFFQRLWAKLKLFVAKLTYKFTNYKDRISQLRAMIQKPDDLKVKVFPEDIDGMAIRSMSSNPGFMLKDVVENIVKVMQDNNKAVDTMVNGHRSLVEKYMSKAADIYMHSKVGKFMNNNSVTGKVIGNFAKNIIDSKQLLAKFEEDHFKGKKLSWYFQVPAEDYESICILRYNGTALIVTNNDEKFRVSKTKLPIKQSTFELLRNGCKHYLTLNECLKYLSALESLVGKMKSDNDNLINKYEATIKLNEANMKNIEKEVAGGKMTEGNAQKQLSELRQLNLINILALPELLFDKLDNFNNLLYLISKSIQGHQREDIRLASNGEKRPRVKTGWDKFKKKTGKFLNKKIF